MHDPRWDSLTDEEWNAFAKAWVDELSGRPSPPLPDLPVLFEDEPELTPGAFVVPMNFTASAEAQWKFIVAVFRQADDNVLGHLAAGPVEHLLSNFGESYIERFETLAKGDSRFAQMLGRCYKHLMTDDVWTRICAVRESL